MLRSLRSFSRPVGADKAGADMWWIIIGAVLALIVLIVLLVMFTGKTRSLEIGLTSCEGKGGRCESLGSCSPNTLPTGAFTCPAGQVCCIGITPG